MVLQIGWHISTTPTIISRIEEVKSLISDDFVPAIQIFTKSPMRFGRSTLNPLNDFDEIRAYLIQNRVAFNIHGHYLANFIQKNNQEKSQDSIAEDLEIIEKISPEPEKTGVVIHMGKNINSRYSFEECCDNFVENLSTILEKSRSLYAKIILETSVPTKNGSDIFHKIENLGVLYDKIPDDIKSRIGFCIDTCHVYASGYDISGSIHDFLDLWNREIGVDKIMLIHLNDSKEKLGSKLDRHFEVGQGHIFRDCQTGLRELLEFADKNSIPIAMETASNRNEEAKFIKQVVKV